MSEFFTNLRVIKKVSLAFAALIATSLIVSTISWITLDKLEQASGWTDHTNKVLSQLSTITASMVNQETGVRGYLVSADEGFLAPQIAGAKDLSQAIAAVKDLTSDNSAQQARLAEVETLAHQWQDDVAAKEITLMGDPATREQARQLEASGAGKKPMDALRAKVKEMSDAESGLLVTRAKAAADASALARGITIAGGITLLVIAGLSLMILNGVLINPLNALARAMQGIARGEAGIQVTGQQRKDELGDLSRAFEENAVRIAQLAEAQKATEESQRVERRQAMLSLADNFEANVGGIVELVSSAATEMQATASQLAATAEETSHQAQAVSAAAEEAGTNVSSVASSAEELGASVNEIGRQVERSAEKSKAAVSEAHGTAAIVAELSEAATRINDIVAMISSIASQTNLLALNATIESARAGEAGKGFAVVASEVKQLASQTAKATDQISQQIASIQSTTDRAVKAINAITGSIVEIDETSAAIASAVEQQSAATREIIHSVSQAATGTTEVTSNITGVARAAEETGAGASQVLSASSELSHQSVKLRDELQKFLMTVRAA